MRLLKFLRHSSRITLFFTRGYDGKWLPQINPVSWCNKGKHGKDTYHFSEPYNLYKLRCRLFKFAGRQLCPQNLSRKESDSWLKGPDGYRCCSYCGSLHFDDFMTLCSKSILDARYNISIADGGHKIYVRQPEVINAGYGGIKYYTCHTPKDVTEAQVELFNEAL